MSAEGPNQLDEEAVVIHELATDCSCLKHDIAFIISISLLTKLTTDRHVTVVGDEGKAPVLIGEDVRELIG